MKKIVFLAGTALLALVACNKTQEPGGPVDFSQYKLSVEPVITRATETNFETGDQIGLSVIRATGEYASNAPLSYDGTAFSGDLNWYQDGEEACTLKAYYPYEAGDKLPVSFGVQADQTQGLAPSDFVSAVKENVLPNANAVPLVFKHRMCRLVVNVKNNSGAPIESVKFEEFVLRTTVGEDLTVKIVDGARWVAVTAFEKDGKYYAIVPPQTVAPAVVVYVNGKKMEQRLVETTFEPGKQYSVPVVVNDGDIKVVLAGEIENWGDGGEIVGGGPATEEHLDEGYILYDGAKYTVKKLKNDLWIMTQSLRFVPAGKTVSSDPADGNGIWNPYTSDGTNCTPVTDEASIEARGLLYDHPTAFGAEITADNFKSFEGTRGICPEGWHVPTQPEWLSILGASNRTDVAAATTDASAVYYDKDYNGARIKAMNDDGFNWDFAGSLTRINNTTTGKYSNVITKTATCSVEEWIGKNAVTYYMGSTGYTPNNTEINRQFMSAMSAFTATYAEGKASIAYTNYLGGYSLRCIRDKQ